MDTRVIPSGSIQYIEYNDEYMTMMTSHLCYVFYKNMSARGQPARIQISFNFGNDHILGEITRLHSGDCFEFEFRSTDRHLVWLVEASAYKFLPSWFTNLFTP